MSASEAAAASRGLEMAHFPSLHQAHAVRLFSTALSLGSGQAYGLSFTELTVPASQKCPFPAGGHQRRRGKKGSRARQSELLQGNIDHQQSSLSPSSQAVGLALCQPCSEKPC